MPLAEHDKDENGNQWGSTSFNSRAPRGARPDTDASLQNFEVSIHVPLAEHDK